MPSKTLETFDNPNNEYDYTIHIRMPEFTCLCPKTGQPDFATLFLDYVPDNLCLELKSLKTQKMSFMFMGLFIGIMDLLFLTEKLMSQLEINLGLF